MQFPYACRRLKRREYFLRNEKMAEAIPNTGAETSLKQTV